MRLFLSDSDGAMTWQISAQGWLEFHWVFMISFSPGRQMYNCGGEGGGGGGWGWEQKIKMASSM